MVYILINSDIQLDWTIFKSRSRDREELRDCLVQAFLVSEGNRWALTPSVDRAERGTVHLTLPKEMNLVPGVYGLNLVWGRNKLPGRHDELLSWRTARSICVSEAENVFAITTDQSSAPDKPQHYAIKTEAATYGRDGLDAWERAVMLGMTTDDEASWTETGVSNVIWSFLGEEGEQQVDGSHLTDALADYAKSEDLNDYVTLDTDQTVTAKKTFSSNDAEPIEIKNTRSANYAAKIPFYVYGEKRGDIGAENGGMAIANAKSGNVLRLNDDGRLLYYGGGLFGWSSEILHKRNWKDVMTFDAVPTSGSTNLVTSGDIKTALDSEAQTRALADTDLHGAIDTERGRAQSVEAGLQADKLEIEGDWYGEEGELPETLIKRTNTTQDNNYSAELQFDGVNFNFVSDVEESGRPMINGKEIALRPEVNSLRSDVTTINGKIPAQASSNNQLADKEYVNSSVATATAIYRGSYNLVSNLSLTTSATEQQIATALATAIQTADNNDYCFVQVPVADATPTEIARVERYKFSGQAWAFEYELNNSDFTAAQWSALNSGITSGLVAKLNGLATVATSGDYRDLNHKPTIGNGTLSFEDGEGLPAGTFSANQTGNVTIWFRQGANILIEHHDDGNNYHEFIFKTTGLPTTSEVASAIATALASYYTKTEADSLLSGKLGTSETAAAATKLQTARNIWGQSFNGTADVSGDLSGVGSLSMNGVLSGARGEVRSIEQIVNDRISVFSCNLSVDVIDANNIRLAVNDGQRAILQAVNTAVYTAEHVYMFVVYNISATNSGYVKFGLSDLASWGIEGTANVSTNAHNIAVIVRATDTYSDGYIYIDTVYGLFGDVIIGNMIALDLTAIFGAGNEPTTADEFARRLGYASIDDVPYIPYSETPIPLNDAMAVGGDLIIREKICSLVRPININGIVFTDEALSGLSELFATGIGDLDVADKNGNVVVRFENGHLITRLFESEKIANYCFPVSEATWQTIGDSITWYDEHPNANLSKGYQTYVREKMQFTSISNIGVNASTAITWASNYLTYISAHDIYTIYLGVNDWGKNTPLGTLADYIAYSSGAASTFYAAYKAIVKKIRSVNQNALILTITPRHSYDFNGFLPATSETANSAGVKLSDIANAIIEISRYEGFPVVDLFYESGLTDANVAAYSIDSALHPNDAGMNLIANMIIEKLKKYYI